MARQPLPRSIRADVWDKSGGACYYCGRTMHPIRDFTVDHVHPVARGGTELPANLVGACRECNARKGATQTEAGAALYVPRSEDVAITATDAAEWMHVRLTEVVGWIRRGQLDGWQECNVWYTTHRALRSLWGSEYRGAFPGLAAILAVIEANRHPANPTPATTEPTP